MNVPRKLTATLPDDGTALVSLAHLNGCPFVVLESNLTVLDTGCSVTWKGNKHQHSDVTQARDTPRRSAKGQLPRKSFPPRPLHSPADIQLEGGPAGHDASRVETSKTDHSQHTPPAAVAERGMDARPRHAAASPSLVMQ